VVAVVLAAGATAGAVGTASAASLHHPAPKPKSQHHPAPKPQHCTTVPGHWKLMWHPAYRDRKHHAHAGYWTRVWGGSAGMRNVCVPLRCVKSRD
jgi:hypothetical protein